MTKFLLSGKMLLRNELRFRRRSYVGVGPDGAQKRSFFPPPDHDENVKRPRSETRWNLSTISMGVQTTNLTQMLTHSVSSFMNRTQCL